MPGLRVGTTLAHFIAVIVIIGLLGGSIFSLSVDVAHHYAVIDAIMKYGSSTAPYLGPMSIYPTLTYWIAAGIGHLVGSGLVGMWMLTLISIYATYYFLFRLISDDQLELPIILLLLVMPELLRFKAFFGFEVIDNFFFPQLVGATVYCGFLLYIARQEKTDTWKNIFFILILAGFTLSVHALPALEILATFGALLVFSTVRTFILTRAISKLNIIRIGTFAVVGLYMLRVHPAFIAMRQLSQNNGSIGIGIDTIPVVVLAVTVIAVLFHELFRFRNDPRVNRLNFLFLSAMTAALGLLLLQHVWLVAFNSGSAYAVKKHFYFVFTIAIVAYMHVIAYRIRPSWSDKYFRRQPIPVGIMIVVGATIMTLSVLKRPSWNRPAIDIYPIVHQIAYAENAVANNHPNFKAGNTAVISPNINFVVRYLISTTAFQMPVSVMPSISMLTNSFDPKATVEYVMVQTSNESRTCPTRYAETSQFTIIPVSCLK